MPSVYDFKPKFQNILRPIANRLASLGVTANQVTISAAILSIFQGTWMLLSQGSRESLFALPLVLFLRMALNAIDGMLAREHKMASPLGAVLNELCDVVSDTMIFLGFLGVPGVHFGLLIAFVILSLLTELQGILAQALKGTRAYQGPMGKSDRAFWVGSMSLALGFGMEENFLNIFFVFACLLLVRTLFNRIRASL